MKRILPLLVFAALAFAGPLQAQVKVGHLNFQQLLSLMPEAKALQPKLEAYGQELQATYNQYLTELQSRQTDYQTNASSWSEVKREAAEEDIQRLVARIEEFQATSEEKLVGKQNELMEPLITKAQDAVSAVGKEKGLTYVLDTSTLLYVADDAVDIFDAVKAKLGL